MNTSQQIQNTGQRDSGFAGTLRNIQLTDIIQMCCLAGASLCVRVKQDKNTGTIYIKDGEVIHAECEATSGVKAFFEILGWQKGIFETQDFCGIEEPTIKEPCQFLLMEAARLSDEVAQAKSNTGEGRPECQDKMRVLIVDDSPIMSKIITSMLVADPSIEVVGSAKNGEEALEKMKSLKPELITMDVNMPVMDGSTALKHIMIESPCPVMIMSNLAPSSYSTILNFLNLGAVDFMSKPVKTRNIVVQQQKMVDRIHIASKAKAKRFQRLRRPKLDASKCVVIDEKRISGKLVIINSGVGGYLEMVNVITSLPKINDATVVSLQSIPPAFAPTLAGYLNLRSSYEVIPLNNNAPLCPGRCYIGTSGSELMIEKSRFVICKPSEEGPNHQNSLDIFLEKAVRSYGDRIMLILLSGADLGEMQGLNLINNAGGQIAAPKLSSCILPATLEPAVDKGLIDNLFDPADVGEVLRGFC